MWLRNAVRNLSRKRQADAELDEEVRGYLELLAAEKIKEGMQPRDALREAKMEFGGGEQVKEQTREVRAGHFLETLWQDAHFGARMLRRSPGFTIVAVLTLALGIGVNTAIFSVVDAVLLKPLRYENPAALTLVWERLPKYNIVRNVVSPPNFFDWEAQNKVFSGMAAFIDQPLNLTGAGEPEQMSVEMTSPNFFSVLGVKPMLGRVFAANADQPGKDNVVVLSYGTWKAKFGADPNIVDKKIELNGKANTVIGVTGPDFDWYIREFSFTHRRPQMWTPLAFPPAAHDRSKSGRYLRVVARMKPGITLSQAQSQMDVLAASLAASLAARYPDYDKNWSVNVVSLREQLSGGLGPALLILLGAVGLVLLIACANLSSLLLARATGRRREIAIRVTLGAGRWRIARQLLTESVLLGLIGGMLGTVVAVWVTRALVHTGSASLPEIGVMSINWRILAFATAATVLAALAAGCLPSLISSHDAIAPTLPEGGRTSSAGRKGNSARNALVVAELGMALVLLTGSGLLIQSLHRLMVVSPGFGVAHLLTFRVALPDSKYATDGARAAFFTALLDRVRQLPGAEDASADSAPPFAGVGSATGFTIVGEGALPVSEQHGTDVRVIEPDYFRTMGIPLLRGAHV